ncbi:MAG TPA: hypothetical protein VFC46_10355 [Humisphaera sp.]|nr:hypothetical protein [Humisphaera sp.]
MIAAGVWGLAGCFYLPVAEHKVDSTQKDFRPLIRKDDTSEVFISGVSTRAAVVAILGPPQYASADERAIGYVYDTAEGLYVWPLCFRAVSDRSNSYALRLEFDQKDHLVRFDTYNFRGPQRLLGIPEGSDDHSFRGISMEWLMRTGPRMFPTNRRIPATRP